MYYVAAAITFPTALSIFTFCWYLPLQLFWYTCFMWVSKTGYGMIHHGPGSLQYLTNNLVSKTILSLFTVTYAVRQVAQSSRILQSPSRSEYKHRNWIHYDPVQTSSFPYHLWLNKGMDHTQVWFPEHTSEIHIHLFVSYNWDLTQIFDWIPQIHFLSILHAC
jgi:hypothetical protein